MKIVKSGTISLELYY